MNQAQYSNIDKYLEIIENLLKETIEDGSEIREIMLELENHLHEKIENAVKDHDNTQDVIPMILHDFGDPKKIAKDYSRLFQNRKKNLINNQEQPMKRKMENPESLTLDVQKESYTSSIISRIIIQMASFFIFFFVFLLISFILIRTLDGSPFMGGGGSIDPNLVAEMEEEAGFNDPILVQFGNYLKELFQFDWGTSLSTSPGTPIRTLIWSKLPHSIEIVIFAFFLAIPMGILLGFLFSKRVIKGLKPQMKNIISLLILGAFSFAGTLITMIFFRSVFAYNLGWFPSQGYIDDLYSSWIRKGGDAYLTGFGIFDTLVTSYFGLTLDILNHLFLPALILSIPLIVLVMQLTLGIIKIFSEKNINTKTEYSIQTTGFMNTSIFGSIIFSNLMIVEYTFNIAGVGPLFLQSLENRDYFLIQGILLSLFLINTLTAIILNIIQISISNHLSKKKTITDENEPSLMDNNSLQIQKAKERQIKANLSSFAKKWIKNPWNIVGLFLFAVVITFTIIGTIKYDPTTLLEIFPNQFQTPSSEYLFGTNRYGQDLFGLFVCGFKPVLLLIITCSIFSSAGFIIGCILVFKIPILNDIIKSIVNGVLLFFSFILLILYQNTGDLNPYFYFTIYSFLIMVRIGIFVSENRNSNGSILEKLTSNIPSGIPYLFGVLFLILSFNLALSYIGYNHSEIIEWGNQINAIRVNFASYPWLFRMSLGIILVNIMFLAFIIGSLNAKENTIDKKTLDTELIKEKIII